MPERQRGECGRNEQRQEGRERERVTSGPPRAGMALRHSPDLPIQPSKIHPCVGGIVVSIAAFQRSTPPSFQPSLQPHRRLRWGHPICRGHRRCSLGSFLLRLLLQLPDGLRNRERLTLQSLDWSWPPAPLPILAQPPPTVSTQKRSLCSKLARAKGPGSVFVHSKAKATMRASMTARWAPCGGKG